MGDSRGIEPPSNGDIRHALTRALAVQIAKYQGQPYTDAALAERVTALPGRVEHLGDDWWLVGVIHDTIAGIELEVRCRPPRLQLREVPDRWTAPPPPVMAPETDHSRHLKRRLRPADVDAATESA